MKIIDTKVLKSKKGYVKLNYHQDKKNKDFFIYINGTNYLAIKHTYLVNRIQEAIDLVKRHLSGYVFNFETKGGGYKSSFRGITALLLQTILSPKKRGEDLKKIKSEKRYLILVDTRQKYRKKQLGRGARARHQLSFR